MRGAKIASRTLTSVTVAGLLFGSTLACQRKGRVDVSEEGALVQQNALPNPLTQRSSARPAEELRLDPALEDLGAPFAGLRVRTLGNVWGESDRVVVLMHGYGARGDDLSSLAARFHEKVPATYLLPEAPFALGKTGRAWFKRDRTNFEEGLSYAQALVDYCSRELPDGQLVIGGFSQGAMLTANLLATAPPQVKAALILSSAALLTSPPTVGSPRIALFQSHGTRDPILPFSEGKALKDRLEKLNFQVTFVEFEGRHQIPPLVVEGAVRFLSEQMTEAEVTGTMGAAH